MAEEGGSNLPNLHALGLLDSKGGSGGGGAGNSRAVDPEDVGDVLKVAADNADYKVAKALSTIPLIGDFLASILPLSAGSTSALSSFETQGIANSMINRGADTLSARGGALATVAKQVFKDKAITDHTTGVGGSASGGGNTSEGGGGTSSSDFSGMTSHVTFNEMMGAVGGSMTNQSWADLGNLQPLHTPNNSNSRGAGMEMV